MCRLIATSLLGLMLTASSTLAAEEEPTALTPAAASAAVSLAQPADTASTISLPEFKAPHRPKLLPSLYAALAFLEGYDAYSTLAALKSDATEANRFMRGITSSPPAFVAVKAGATAASIMGAERLWKDNHRTAAVMIMVASNGLMAVVAAHNSAVLRRAK
jgi:Domain of unknown function (DUF5658)